MSDFAQAVRDGTFSKGDNRNLVEGTVLTAIANVTQAFWGNSRNKPRLDKDGKTSFTLQEQYRGYTNQDLG